MTEDAKDIKAKGYAGNWREKDKWSDRAVGYYDVVQTKYANIGETDRRMENAVGALVEDLYMYNDHPEILALLNPVASMLKFIRTGEVKELLRQYGRNDIIYVPQGSEEEWPSAMRISPEIGLAEPGVGMPVGEFLRWYKGGDKLPSAVLEEWIGVPRLAISTVYWTLVDFFRANIILMHREYSPD